MEGIVAVGPEDGLLAVDVDLCFAHRSIKHQSDAFAGGGAKCAAIPSNANVGESPSASRLDGSLLFEVLADGHILQIVLARERACYGPVVGYFHLLPVLGLEVRGFGALCFAKMEKPSGFEKRFAALGR